MLLSDIRSSRPTNEAAVAPPQLRASDKNEGSLAGDVLKTIGLVTGIGPLAAGLMSIFGGSRTENVEPALLPFSLPESISLEAGLAHDRSLRPISYSAQGTARADAPNSASSSGTAPSIQINVQTIDSRSFLDHSEQIAQAVREAMLHSHGLNDVISEL